MNINFRYQLSGLIYLSFFDAERVLDAARGWANQRLFEGERRAAIAAASTTKR